MSPASPALASIRGEILDCDGHVALPSHMWGDAFGEAGSNLRPIYDRMIKRTGRVTGTEADDVSEDCRIITDETVSTRTGVLAPGTLDMSLRPAVMDHIGVKKGFVFPGGVGLIADFYNSSSPQQLAEMYPTLDQTRTNLQELGAELAVASNDFAIKQLETLPSDRVRFVAMVGTRDLDSAMAEIRRCRAAGIKAVTIPSSFPPGGMSPADERLDEFWSTFVDNKIPALFHIGGEAAFKRSELWGQVEAFQHGGESLEKEDMILDPHAIACVHFAAECFLSAMILGGVFDRHPELYVGVVELGAHWIGPLSQNLDIQAEVFKYRLQANVGLKMRPSDYIRRNVRVVPYNHEPVHQFIEQYGLEEVYVFGSDYPHREGGGAPVEEMANRISHLGNDMLKRFFVDNAQVLMQ